MKPQVLIIAPLLPNQMAQLEAAYDLHRLDKAADKAAFLAEVGPRIEAAVTVGSVGFTRAQAEALPKCKIVSTSSVGYDKIDLAACAEHGIAVTNTPDVLTDDVADTALMLLLAAARQLPQGEAHVRSGAWAKGPMPLTMALKGKTLGVVGLGRIGQAIADRAEAFGMAIAYSGRSPKDVPYAYYPTPEALAAEADVIVAAAAGGPETKGLVSRAALEALGPKGIFVNIARGSVVDEAALIELLQSGKLGAAGLDVFENEPTPDPAFATLDTAVLYPHHASGTVETREAMSQLVVDNLAAHFAGQPLPTPVPLPKAAA